MTYLLRKGNKVLHDSFRPNEDLWMGQYSVARIQGSIAKFVNAYLFYSNAPILYIKTDGDLSSTDVDPLLKLHNVDEPFLIATLAQRTEDPKLRYLYLPLSDDFFDHGTGHYFPNLPAWETRSNTAFWRGSCSGGGLESFRCRTVAKLIDQPLSDVKLLRCWNEGKHIPDHYFGNYVALDTFFQYKIFFIVGGNTIASNHMWGFATGCVPFIICDAKCWFLKFAQPFVHYIPIRDDLEDLLEKIDWVRTHDAEAKQIAERALQFSKDHFTPGFQRRYLMGEIDRLLSV
jgi:hypothetical protein